MVRETLTKAQIVTAAIELLDADGLDGLSMRALGKRLGSAATAVYWHVGSKENLVALAADQIWHEIELPEPADLGWRGAASRMAGELHAMLTRHPWLVQTFGSLMLYGQGNARYDEHSLVVFEAAGFSSAQADQAAATVLTFVLGNALGPAAEHSLRRRLHRDGADAQQQLRTHMASAHAIAADYPRLRARLDTTAASNYAAAPDDSFEFGLTAVLNGLETALGRG